MYIQLIIIGILLIALALLHIIFPKYFNWETELKSLSLINRQMMKVHTFFIGLTVFLMGLLCLTSTTELIKTDLGQKVSLGLGLFWVTRLLIQFFIYSNELWRGKRFETIIHFVFSFLWAYFSVVFLAIYFNY